MRKLYFVFALGCAQWSHAQNVGIGTNTPKARLHVADSSVVFTAPAVLPVYANTSEAPVPGPGNRMMWYADMGAFRSGGVETIEWNKQWTGKYSIAMGYNTVASGKSSVALGENTSAASPYSTALGHGSSAIAEGAFASGSSAAAAPYSTATGMSIAYGTYSFSAGINTETKPHGGFVAGLYNDNSDAPSTITPLPTDRLFQLGNGSAGSGRSNALTILRNGNMGIGNLNPLRPLSFPATLGEKIVLYPGGAGEVGIGVYGNEMRLHSDNPGASITFGTQTNAGVFTEAGRFQISGGIALRVNGNIWANGTTYSSDARFKKNISTLDNALQKILLLRGVSYEMMTNEYPDRNFSEGKQVGLLAQEVEPIVPEVVSTAADGYKSVDYAKLVPILIEAIKTQQEQIKKLEQKLEKLSVGK